MKVNGLELPRVLRIALLNGAWMSRGGGYSGWWRDKHHLALFKTLFPRTENPLPQFYDYDLMLRDNKIWYKPQDIIGFYLGEFSNDYPPGNADPRLTVIIGTSEPDSPIALDYRTSPPRIIYLCDVENKTLWIEAAKNFESLMSKLEMTL
ncbi:MAG: hypothetical protein GY795_38675 [Desulfobacterales bacterium]|nr:hypothetical protein [Desulfobacterales bacterium]